MARFVRPDDVPVGVRVARDVLTGHAASGPLLRAGAVVTEGYRAGIARAGVGGVYIDDALGEGIELLPPLDERTRLEVTNILTDAFGEVPAALAAGRTLPHRTLLELESAVASIIDEITEADTTTLAIACLASAEAYTLEHSIDVTVLGLLIAYQLFCENGRIDHARQRSREGIDNALRRIGIGLILHDIGKVGIPPAILQKPGPLTAEEEALVRRHPQIGVGLLDHTQVSSHALAVVRWHHERFDGGGYPDGIAGEQIPQFARIAAAADVFSAMTTRRPYQEAFPPHVALAAIRNGAGTHFDPEVVEATCAVVAPYPPGSEIPLADGRRGVVARVRPEQLGCPVVRIVRDAAGSPVTPYEVDLADEPQLAPAA